MISYYEDTLMAWAEPPGKVVWDENPDTAAALLAGPGYKRIEVLGLDEHPLLANWQRGAAAKPPPVAGQVFDRRRFAATDSGQGRGRTDRRAETTTRKTARTMSTTTTSAAATRRTCARRPCCMGSRARRARSGWYTCTCRAG